jgi:hypothetical protein
MSVQLIRHRFTVEEYYQQMGQAGVLRDDDRVELIAARLQPVRLTASVFERWRCGSVT